MRSMHSLGHRFDLQVYDTAGHCQASDRQSDAMGDHGMICVSGGERIVRHNALRDAPRLNRIPGPPAPDKGGVL